MSWDRPTPSRIAAIAAMALAAVALAAPGQAGAQVPAPRDARAPAQQQDVGPPAPGDPGTPPETAGPPGTPSSPKPDADPKPEADPKAPKKDQGGGSDDPYAMLDGTSPECRQSGLDAAARTRCRGSGSIANAYPLSSYGLDNQIDVKVTNPGDALPAAIHSIIQALWSVLLTALRGVLLLLEWAYSLDLLNGAMSDVEKALHQLGDETFGDTWLLAALSVAGLWGIWNGLVRRKTIETVGGLAATVALMVGSLVVIHDPQRTVGHVLEVGNQASLGVLGAATRGTVADPPSSLAEGEAGLFNTLVLRPWCALQFASVDGCLKKQHGTTIADVWLAFPAGSDRREALYAQRKKDATKHDECGLVIGPAKDFCGNDRRPSLSDLPIDGPPDETEEQRHESAMKVRADDDPRTRQALKLAKQLSYQGNGIHTDPTIQAEKGSFNRFGLLLLILVGQAGAIAFLGWIGLKLVFAMILSVVFTLGTTVMMLVSAFGEAGRATFVSYAKRLLGALIAKLVFSVLLAIVLFSAGIINHPGPGATGAATASMGWLPVWLLNIVFWWGLMLKRGQIVGFLTLDKRSTDGGLGLSGNDGNGFRMASVYYGMRMLRDGIGATTALPRAAARGTWRAGRAGARVASRRGLEARAATSNVLRNRDREHLGLLARRARGVEQAGDLRRAQSIMRGQDGHRLLLESNRTRQRQVGRAIGALDRDDPGYAADRGRLLDERDRLAQRQDRLQGKLGPSPETDWARSTLADVQRPPRELSERDVDAWAARRRTEIATLPPEHPANLTAAGIDPIAYRRAGSDAKRVEMVERSRRAMDGQRRLIDRADDPRARDGQPMSRAEIQARRGAIAGAPRAPVWKSDDRTTELDAQRAQEAKRLREQRRFEKQRRNLRR